MHSTRQSLSILGSTGSIGCSALEVARQHRDKIRIVSLAAGNNREALLGQIREFRPALASIASREDALWLSQQVDIPVFWGPQGLRECVHHPDVSMVLAAMVGSAGLAPVIEAIQAGRDIALANKEILVAGGELVMKLVKQHGVRLLPVDSEHSAIMQCLEGHRHAEISSIILTASGGAFRDWSLEKMQSATVNDALRHPNWNMGRKITIDSATMMNKGLELIEARWLFDVPPARLDVVIHPESIVHSMVEYVDGSMIAQLGTPDMQAPIAYALFYPHRYALDIPPLKLHEIGALHFQQPDLLKYPCLRMAQWAMEQQSSASVVLNGSNEVAVQLFLNGKIPFAGISSMVERTLEQHTPCTLNCVEDVLEIDKWSRRKAQEGIVA